MPHCFVMESLKGRGGNERPLLSVVDDDESVRESLPDLLREFGFAARAFSSAEEFLTSDCLGQTSCLILDIAMPGMTGPELYQELKRRGNRCRSYSSPVKEMRRFVLECSSKAQPGFCSNHSVMGSACGNQDGTQAT